MSSVSFDDINILESFNQVINASQNKIENALLAKGAKSILSENECKDLVNHVSREILNRLVSNLNNGMPNSEQDIELYLTNCIDQRVQVAQFQLKQAALGDSLDNRLNSALSSISKLSNEQQVKILSALTQEFESFYGLDIAAYTENNADNSSEFINCLYEKFKTDGNLKMMGLIVDCVCYQIDKWGYKFDQDGKQTSESEVLPTIDSSATSVQSSCDSKVDDAIAVNQDNLSQEAPVATTDECVTSEQVSVEESSPVEQPASIEQTSADQGTSVEQSPLEQPDTIEQTSADQATSVEPPPVEQPATIEQTSADQATSVEPPPVEQPAAAKNSMLLQPELQSPLGLPKFNDVQNKTESDPTNGLGQKSEATPISGSLPEATELNQTQPKTIITQSPIRDSYSLQPKDIASSMQQKDLSYFQDSNAQLKGSTKSYSSGGQASAPASSIYRTGKGSAEKVVAASEKFAIHNAVTIIKNTISVSELPNLGETIPAQQDNTVIGVQLLKFLNKGNHGMVYQTNIPDVVAKIFNPYEVNSTLYEKLKLITSKHLVCEGICFPTHLLYNRKREFIGYLMPQAQGYLLSTSVFGPAMLKSKFPSWQQEDKIKLCITILEKIKYLHDRNIILGNINPNNILVESQDKVHLISTDGYQVAGFPCFEGNIEYTSPENQGRPNSYRLLSMGQDRFALAILLFKILMLGKHPYSSRGGSDPSSNISSEYFAYEPGAADQGDIPDGPWFNLWSEIDISIQQAFYDTFDIQGKYHAEHLRLSSAEWLDKFQRCVVHFDCEGIKSWDDL